MRPRKKVLLVHYDQSVLGQWDSAFVKAGCDTEMASSALKAYALINRNQSEPYDKIIITDLLEDTQPGTAEDGGAKAAIQLAREKNRDAAMLGKLGGAIIKHACEEGLLPATTPVHLVVNDMTQHEGLPENVALIASSDAAPENVVAATQPGLRGGGGRPTGTRQQGQ